MKRLTYIYWATPLFVALSCGQTFIQLLGTIGGTILGSVIGLTAWGVVWLRMFGQGRLRPEFAVLSVLPVFMYLLGKCSSPETINELNTPAVQNLYFFCWLAAMIVGIITFMPSTTEKKKPLSSDRLFILMAILTVVYGITTWVNYAADLFNI